LVEPALPLDSLDQNVVCEDALFYEWPRADAIIGNPPFLGGKHMRMSIGDEYVDRVFARFPEVKDSVDFCAYWFRLAHDHLSKGGRAGLVATNSISQGRSRVAALDYVTQNTGLIYEAVSSQPWSGEAKVYVSLVNWLKEGKPSIYYLDDHPVEQISSALKASTDVSSSMRLNANLNWCFQGVIPVGKGFLVTEEKAQAWIKADLKNKDILKLFSMGSNLAKEPHGLPDRWIIDFNELSVEESGKYILPFQHVKENVKPERLQNRSSRCRKYWWQFLAPRPNMRSAIKFLEFYFVVPRVSKWAIFMPFPCEWLPGDLNIVFASDDFYLLGILTSYAHRTWVKVNSSTLKGDTRYTNTTCFETFPFPQTPSAKIVQKIRQTAIDLHGYRSQMMEKHQYGITKLYNQFFHEPTSQLAKLHKQLDQLTLQAYGFSETDDILEQLLNLNLQLAAQEQTGATIVGPYDPHNPPQRKP
jgi:hypothetical protein